METLFNYIHEKLKITKKNFPSIKHYPKNRNALMDIIEKKVYGESGKESNKIIDVSDIDISDINPKSLGIIFSYYEEVEEIKGLEYCDVSEIIKMHELFGNCKNLKYINGIEDWDVSNCDRFDGMFLNCESLKNLDLSNWEIKETAKVSGMFEGCNTGNINMNYKKI